MKISVDRNAFRAALRMVQPACASRGENPILTSVLARAAARELTLMATDLEIGSRCRIADPRLELPGDAMLPAARLAQILREAPEGEIGLEIDESRCQVLTHAGRYEFPAEDPADFPELPDNQSPATITLAAERLRQLIRRTAFAVGSEDTRYTLTGVLWEPVAGGGLRLAATDKQRLALAGHDVGGPADGPGYLIPGKALRLLQRHLAGCSDNEMIEVHLRSSDALFRMKRSTVFTRLLEGSFPPYRAILAREPAGRVGLAAGALSRAVRQAAVMADGRSRRVLLRFEPGRLLVEARGTSAGRSAIEVPLSYEGPPVSSELNAQHLTAFLQVLGPATALRLELVGDRKPIRCWADEDYLMVFVPQTG